MPKSTAQMRRSISGVVVSVSVLSIAKRRTYPFLPFCMTGAFRILPSWAILSFRAVWSLLLRVMSCHPHWLLPLYSLIFA